MKVQLSKKEKELEDVDKLLNDCVAENDVMFERFNEELVKMSNGFKLGKGEAEVLEMLKVVREEQARLKRENMLLRRENIALKTPALQASPEKKGPGHHYGMSF